jgi:rfaE bifunctional protein kinase chain/domain
LFAVTTPQILAQFPRLAALVIGDICLDRWCTYDPASAEPSRETGIPRIAVIGAETTPGAGGTVANNLAALGAGRVAVLGAVGCDGHGFELRQALAARGIENDLLVEAPGLLTFTYTKLLNSGTGAEDLPRVDFIVIAPLAEPVEREIVDRFSAVAPSFDVILVSDQAETSLGGVVTAAVRNAIGRFAREHPDKVVWVDSRMRVELFRDVLVKPNEREAHEACLRLFGKLDLPGLRRTIGSKPLMVTHGGRGAEIHDDQGVRWMAANPVENPVDICGAGDSFSAGGALALAVTSDALTAARIGNLVASITIMKKGTGTASPEEVLAAEGRTAG